MKKIVAYLTLSVEGRLNTLDEKVNKAIKEGWQPFGGISVIKQDGASEAKEYLFTQTMVKFEDEKLHFPHFDID